MNAAFPSIAHLWIMLVLRDAGAPLGLLNFLKVMYASAEAYICAFGLTFHLCTIPADIIQGGPLNGTLYVISIDIFIAMISELVTPPDMAL